MLLAMPMADTPIAGNRSAGLAAAPGVRPSEVVLVGAGERARAWLAPLRGSTRLRLVATVTRGDESAAPEFPRYRSLGEAMQAQPAAAFAIGKPRQSRVDPAQRAPQQPKQ